MAYTTLDSLWNHFHRFVIDGVDFSLDGNGGIECINYIPLWQRFIETLFFGWIAITGIRYAINNIKTEEEEEMVIYSSNKEFSNDNNVKHDIYSPTPTPTDPFIQMDKDNLSIISSTSSTLSSSEYSTPLIEFSPIMITPIENNIGNWRLFLHSTIITIYCLIFGAELAFKLISGTAIFLLNPCHLTTIIQLFLLVFPSNNHITKSIFRVHTYTLAGALLALLFPILNTRNLHGEQFIYFAQHIFILIIPFYLISLGGPFTPEPLFNINWAILGYSILSLYHLLVLQVIGLATKVNLNCIICPGVSDPFACRLWRIIAFSHQALAVPLVSKIYCFLSIQAIKFSREYNLQQILNFSDNKTNNNNNSIDVVNEIHTKIE
uniref:Transmembrane protein 164 n=1 Tax=Parastrongyloides trichosuri TaxID=131310 RepID=A0A0N4ZVW2_PARTI